MLLHMLPNAVNQDFQNCTVSVRLSPKLVFSVFALNFLLYPLRSWSPYCKWS